MRLNAIGKQVSLSLCNSVNKYLVNIFSGLDIFVCAGDVGQCSSFCPHGACILGEGGMIYKWTSDYVLC